MAELKVILLFSSIIEIVPMRIDFIDFTNNSSEFRKKILQQESKISPFVKVESEFRSSFCYRAQGLGWIFWCKFLIKKEKLVLIFGWDTLSVLTKQTSCVKMRSHESADLRVWKRLTVTVGISFGDSSIQLVVLTELVGTSSAQSN